MRAALLFGPDDVRIEDVPKPVPGPGEVLVKVAHNGICGSDLHIIHAPLRRPAPIGLGHEFAGTIEAVGAGVSTGAIGARVCVRPMLACQTCQFCVTERPHLCEQLEFLGTGTANGGLAEWISVPESMTYLLPPSVSLEAGALVEPMSVSLHAVTSADVQSGDSALVLGGGPIGIGVVLALRALGVDDVLVVEPSPTRRRCIADLGAEVIDPHDADVAAVVRRRTDGVGVTAAFDCAGVPTAFDTALTSTRPQGTVSVIAVHTQPLNLDVRRIQFGEKRIQGSLAYGPGVFERVIELMAAGAYPITGWVDHVPLDAFAEDGLRAVQDATKVKVLVDV